MNHHQANGLSSLTNPPIELRLWRDKGKKIQPDHQGNNQNASAMPLTAPYPTFPPTGYPPYPPYPMYPTMGFPNFHPTPHAQPTDHQLSPPPADGIGVDDFCTEYNLGAEVLDGLTALRFRIGDDHWTITPEALSEVHFAPHHWGRFCRAYRKYKHANK